MISLSEAFLLANKTRPEVQVKDFHPVIEIGDHILHCRKNMENRQL
jgi:hypothetical protein